ncbi:ROK family protein [Corynebacterium sp.]|uniref:ROK family protein n=1 Tax=Corynebacterium sp. TaxID=1720 RepID=UPI002632F191|nr:ROK family protein [Corynebacterium sp.]
MSTEQASSAEWAGITVGIDVGGSAIKAGFVDTRSHCVVGERFTVPTPQPATPERVAGAAAALATQALAQEVGAALTTPASPGWFRALRIGVAIPSVVTNQEARTAANIAPSWVGTRPAALFDEALRQALSGGASGSSALQVEWFFLNDADAAGISECGPFSADEAADPEYSRLFLTLGTGIGSALFRGARLYPNTELGHLTVLTDDGSPSKAERWASAVVKARQNLTFPEWAGRLSTVLNTYVALLRPQELILGGGISAEAERWLPMLNLEEPSVRVSIARHFNSAGVIGAGLAAAWDLRP